MIIIEGRKTRRMFNPPEEHTTYTNEDGDNIPSSTTVLKILSKDALVHWANYLGWKRKNYKTELETSAIIGTLTHGYIEQITRGDKIDLDIIRVYDDEIYYSVLNALTSFSKWWKENKDDIEVLQQEYQMSSDLYGGTADLICRYKGKLCILDYKTSKSVYYTMFLQLASYVRLYEYNNPAEQIEEVAILRLDKKHGHMAEFTTMENVRFNSELVDDFSVRELIEEYIKTYMKIVSLFYDINDISEEWK